MDLINALKERFSKKAESAAERYWQAVEAAAAGKASDKLADELEQVMAETGRGPEDLEKHVQLYRERAEAQVLADQVGERTAALGQAVAAYKAATGDRDRAIKELTAKVNQSDLVRRNAQHAANAARSAAAKVATITRQIEQARRGESPGPRRLEVVRGRPSDFGRMTSVPDGVVFDSPPLPEGADDVDEDRGPAPGEGAEAGITRSTVRAAR